MTPSPCSVSRRWWCATLVLAALSSGVVAQDLLQGRALVLSALHRIPYARSTRDIRDGVVLGGMRYEFLFDTGAPLCISQRIQDANRYPVISEAVLVDAHARTATTTIVLVDTLRYGGSIFCDVPAVVLDLVHSPLAKAGVEGMLGSNVLQHMLVRFDLPNKEILLSPDTALVGWDPSLAVPATLDAQGNFRMACRIGDRLADTASFDSGMAELYVVDHAVVEANIGACTSAQLRPVRRRTRPSKGLLGAPVERPVRYRTNSLRMGAVELGAVELVGTASRSRLGRKLLRQGVLIINYPQRAYHFSPSVP